MFKVYLSSRTSRQLLKEVNNRRASKGRVPDKLKLEIFEEFKNWDFKKGTSDVCSCIEFYNKEDIFVDCIKFNCVCGKDCSCCHGENCIDNVGVVRSLNYKVTVTREDIEFSQNN
jgi:hypothetical protein